MINLTQAKFVMENSDNFQWPFFKDNMHDSSLLSSICYPTNTNTLIHSFGSGMVIYWFGYVDELDNNRNRGIVLHDKFPDRIITLDELL